MSQRTSTEDNLLDYGINPQVLDLHEKIISNEVISNQAIELFQSELEELEDRIDRELEEKRRKVKPGA